jgi:hypothetical protein
MNKFWQACFMRIIHWINIQLANICNKIIIYIKRVSRDCQLIHNQLYYSGVVLYLNKQLMSAR